MTKVSVIVATYRREQELKNALNSLAEQTYESVEIILVDDNGSREWNRRVAAVAEAFQRNHPAVELKVVVNENNLGSGQARNAGIQKASGQYITFLDDDDLYLPEKVRKQVEFMEAGRIDYSITDLDLFSEDGRLVDRRIRSFLQETTQEALTRYHLMYHLTGTDTLMFRKAYIEKIGGFAPLNVGDEFYLMQRAIDGGGKFGYLPGCDVKAYVHTGKGGLSSGDGKIDGENQLYAFKKTFFPVIDGKTKRFIIMRHYAVIAYAELRRKQHIPFLLNAGMAFLSSPLQCLVFLRNRCCR